LPPTTPALVATKGLNQTNDDEKEDSDEECIRL
jgi:hypothetical protein